MSFEIARKVIDYVLTNNHIFNEECVIWDFIGGEPLLEMATIDLIIDYAINKSAQLHHKWYDNFKIRITTNGLLYSSNMVQQFIAKYKSHLDISISIDGTKQKNDINRIFPNGKGSYDNIIDNVKLWKSQFSDIGTKMVISHSDIPYVYESARHLLELGVNRLDMNTVVENVWQDGDERIFEKQLVMLADYVVDNDLYYDKNLYIFERIIGQPLQENDNASPCGSMMLSVDASGTFYTCLRFAQYSLREQKARNIGNVFDGIDTNKLRPYIAMDFKSINLEDKCANCEIAKGCKYCPAENYDSSNTGTLFQRATAVCKMHKARVRAKNYYWNRIANKETGRQWRP